MRVGLSMTDQVLVALDGSSLVIANGESTVLSLWQDTDLFAKLGLHKLRYFILKLSNYISSISVIPAGLGEVHSPYSPLRSS